MTLWCFSRNGATPCIMPMALGSSGSSTLTTWKRRARAASFSKYFLYSDQVVAAMVRSSPRARAGLRRLAASPCPADPPAPIIVCASSMKRMIGTGEAFTSLMTDLRRFSNSPLIPAPACRSPRSRTWIATFWSGGGTSPSAILRANPSTTAVLPTPASPVRMGLFWRRRIRMSTICRISISRPRTGSISPFCALAVRLTVNWSRALVPDATGRDSPAAVSAAGTFPLSASSRDPSTMAERLLPSVSTEIFRNPSQLPISIRAVSSFAMSARRACPDRMVGDEYSTEATSHASRIIFGMRGERAGVRAFPDWNASIARARSATTRPSLISKWRRILCTSVFGISRSLTRKCSRSTS